MNGTSLRTSALIATAATCLLLLAFGAHFALAQNVWIDESTQLSGATLGVGRLISWLTGLREPAFGVPADRMPPISYLIDAACYRTVCAAPTAWRFLHLAFAVAGAGVATWAVARRHGLVAGLVTGLFLALSAKLAELGVEIRAYPIFFAITCVQIAWLWRLVEAERLTARGLGLFLLLGLASAYTHFFGLVSSMALFTGLFVARVRSVRDALAVVGAAAVLVVLCAGLAPFIMTASAISNDLAQTDNSAHGIALYFLRLVGQPANVVSPAGAALFLAPLGLLLVLALVRAGLGFRAEGEAYRRGMLTALLVALASGIAVTLLASFVAKGFNPLKPTYSFWVLPVLAVVLGLVCAPDGAPAWLRRAAAALAVLMLAGAAVGQATMLRHAGWFVHAPSSAIRAAVGDTPADTAIVYEGAWGYGFFPTYYYYHAALDQWLVTPEGELRKIALGGDPVAADPSILATKRRIILVRITLRDYHDLRALQAGRPDHGGGNAAGEGLPAGQPAFDHLAATARITNPGLYWADITTYERTAR
jgi:hypothetical protein